MAGCVRTGFVPQLGAIGPVSPLLAGHSCGEFGQLNSVAFIRRQKGERLVLDAHRKWELAGYEEQGAQSFSSPINS